MRLHFNKSNGIFTVRRSDRTTVHASRRHMALPVLGGVVSLAPRTYLLITRGEYLWAMKKGCPQLEAVITKCPRTRMFIKWLKEVTK